MKQKVLEYNCIFQQEKSGFSVWVPTLPGCASQGDTFEEALDNIKEAIALYVEDIPDVSEEVNATRNQFMVPVVIHQ